LLGTGPCQVAEFADVGWRHHSDLFTLVSPRLVEAILQGRQPVELTATSLTELACEHSVLLSPIDFLEIPEPFANRQRQPLLKHQSRRGGTGSPIPRFFRNLRGPANKQPYAAVIAGTAAAQPPSIVADSIGSRSRSQQRS
jgi:hypothetical protein